MGLADNSTAVLNTAVGVFAHKWADTLALSLVLQKSHTKVVSLLLMLPLQALACPLGIFLGLVVSSNVSEAATGFTLCATAGFLTFFFASDIVPDLFNGKRQRTKFALALAGIGFFTLLLSTGETVSGD